MTSQPPTNTEPVITHAGNRPRLENQMAIAASLLAVAITIALAVVSYITVQQNLRQSFGERLRDIAGVIATQVDGDMHAGLVSNEQKFTTDYNLIRRAFIQAEENAPEIAYVYTLRLIGDDVVFVVDSDPIPTDINEVYVDAADFAKNLFGSITKPVADSDFYTDEWGTFLSGYAPIYNASGRLDAILAVDISAATVLAHERSVLTILLISLIPLLGIMSLMGFTYGRSVAATINQITLSAQRLQTGDLNVRIQPDRSWSYEATRLAEAYNAMAENQAKLLATLEERVEARAKESARQTEYVKASSDVAAATNALIGSERLMSQVVELIRERFKLYYVGLFLVDSTEEWAVLQAGTGEAGQRMVARGHRIQVGQGMIGWSIANAQPRISLEAGEDRVRLATSELPLTRSEAAIPLRSRERVLGALTVQSGDADAFDQSLLLTFQTMADQIAVALDNARLLDESRAAMEAGQRAFQQHTQRSWLEFLRSSTTSRAYTANSQGVSAAALEPLPALSAQVVTAGRMIELPVKVRGLDLGRLVANKPANRGDWRPDEVELMQDFVEQVNAALENARLYSETQRSAERERILSEITSVVRNSTSVDAILQNAVSQLAAALNVPQAAIRLYTGETEKPAAPDFQEPAQPESAAG